MKKEKEINLSSLAERWPSSIVPRTEIKKFTGGLINEKTIANLDSQGMGINGRLRIGRKICYQVNEVIKWLESRAEKC